MHATPAIILKLFSSHYVSYLNALALSSNKSLVNSTIEQFFRKLFIDEWNVMKKYNSFCNPCQPIECIYIHEIKHGTGYIITPLFSLAGSTTSVLKTTVTILVKVAV